MSTIFPLPSSPHCAPTITTAGIWSFLYHDAGEAPCAGVGLGRGAILRAHRGDALRAQLGEIALVAADEHDPFFRCDALAGRAEGPGERIDVDAEADGGHR